MESRRKFTARTFTAAEQSLLALSRVNSGLSRACPMYRRSKDSLLMCHVHVCTHLGIFADGHGWMVQ